MNNIVLEPGKLYRVKQYYLALENDGEISKGLPHVVYLCNSIYELNSIIKIGCYLDPDDNKRDIVDNTVMYLEPYKLNNEEFTKIVKLFSLKYAESLTVTKVLYKKKLGLIKSFLRSKISFVEWEKVND